MDHPLRTLLYELFVEPFLRLLQQPLERKASARPTKDDTRERHKKRPRIEDRVQLTSNCRRQLLPNNAPR